MDIDQLVKIIDSITRLLAVLVWPMLLAFILVRFAPAFKQFFTDLSEFSFKGGGFEATAKRKQAEASAALVAASVARQDAGTKPESAAREAKEAADVVAESVNSRVIRRASEATILWVDDRPNNNIYERKSLEALGVSFVLVTSTEEALEKLRHRKFNAVISDMGRPPDNHAGYTLLERMRASGNRTPVIIYAGSNAPEHKAEARSRDALGATNRASELFSYVLTAINQGG